MGSGSARAGDDGRVRSATPSDAHPPFQIPPSDWYLEVSSYKALAGLLAYGGDIRAVGAALDKHHRDISINSI